MTEAFSSSEQNLPSARETPIALPGERSGYDDRFKIDGAIRDGNLVMVFGWTTAPTFEVSLFSEEGRIRVETVRTVRADVGRSLGRPYAGKLGFAFVEPVAGPCEARLEIQTPQGNRSCEISFDDRLTEDARTRLADASFETLTRLPVGSRTWRKLLRGLPATEVEPHVFTGHIDAALSWPSAHVAVVRGWEIHNARTLLWLEDDNGRAHDLDKAYRWRRSDAQRPTSLPARGFERSGFLKLLELPKGASRLKLRGATAEGVSDIHAIDVQPLPATVRRAARGLAETSTPETDFRIRARAVDLPLLDTLQKDMLARLQARRPRIHSFGDAPDNPSVSLIVPVTRRMDTVEHQLMELARDPDASGCEVIYVTSSDKVTQDLVRDGEGLQDLYGVPFRLLSLTDPAGPDALAAVGARHATSETLVFAAGDVIPLGPGWITHLTGALSETIGAVSPRLLGPAGGISYAGAGLHRNAQTDIWTVRSRAAGLDPGLDSTKGPTPTDLASPACFAIHRSVLDDLHGLRADYPVDGYAVADLSLRLRDSGREILYLPDVSLMHLQSTRNGGDDAGAALCTRISSLRFEARWKSHLGAEQT